MFHFDEMASKSDRMMGDWTDDLTAAHLVAQKVAKWVAQLAAESAVHLVVPSVDSDGMSADRSAMQMAARSACD